MPPSPSLRYSPREDRRMENIHKRGRSFESGLPLKAKDDDLALFNDMENRERDNFLLHTSDDFEDSISKLRYFSDLKLSITVPVRGESSDLLNADREKNDYDWLLTPPDTPLFSSLDDEHQPANLLPRGRPRSQPIPISRSPANERAHRTSRSSASPHRLSPSPRSNNSLGQVRGRPSSAPRSSPPPVLRPITPSRRPSTPPNKPSTPPPRSSTPTMRRMSTGSSGPASSNGRRGISPVNANRGNSASPKLRGWQANLDRFSNDAPPNLRTSLPDRQASHARGLSPSSRNGKDASSRSGRQSMSPTASRSASSSRSHERDRLSTYSKGSVASSGDDDVDSLQSVTVGISNSPAARKNGVMVNNNSITFSKKPSRTVSASSAPKRSFDSALRQMEHRKIPQNMFRPLLSSVPATTFYIGKANSMSRPMFSRNSSLTTSSNASSELSASVAPDIEGCDHDQNDLAGEWERTQYPDNHEDIFIFDTVGETNEDDGHEICGNKPQNNDHKVDIVMTNKVDLQKFENSPVPSGDAASIATALESSCAYFDHSQVGCHQIMANCTKCHKRICVMDVNGNTNVCQECAEKDGLFTSLEPITQDQAGIEMDRLCSGVQTSVPELPEKSDSEIMLYQPERIDKYPPDCLPDCSPLQLVINQREEHHSVQQLDKLQEANDSQDNNENKFQQSPHPGHRNLRVNSPEGTGISVLLLQRSSSSKWPFLQGRALSATNILCSEPSYARDNMNAMKRSFGRDSASASSSVDLGSSRQTEDRVQRQSSSKKFQADNSATDNDAKARSTGSYTEVSINIHKATFCPKNETEEYISSFAKGVGYEAFQETVLITEEHKKSLENGKLCTTESLSIREAVDGDTSVPADSCLAINTSDSQILSCSESIHLQDRLVADNLNDEDCISCVSAEEDLSKNSDRSIQDIEVPNHIPDFSVAIEDFMLNDACPNDNYDFATKNSSVVVLESENDHDSFQDMQSECMPSENPSLRETFHGHSASTASDKGVLVSALESNIIDHACGVHEPTVTVEGPKSHISRSLTLEEATDTILFCSSIIHDLAYKAANIGMEKELMLLEGSRPMVTILGSSVPSQKDSRKMPVKNRPKSPKFKLKRLEAHTKPTELGSNVKVDESTPSNAEVPNKADSTKPPKLESKCNCTVM